MDLILSSINKQKYSLAYVVNDKKLYEIKNASVNVMCSVWRTYAFPKIETGYTDKQKNKKLTG